MNRNKFVHEQKPKVQFTSIDKITPETFAEYAEKTRLFAIKRYKQIKKNVKSIK
jgi:hypothetical protein